MGFRNGAFAKVWEVTPVSNTNTKLRISVSRKNKMTNTYEQDFSGYVSCIGTVAATKALKLKEGARIKLGECDVSTKYDPQKKTTYTNYKVFSFESDDVDDSKPKQDHTDPQPTVDDGEIDDSRLPF